MDFETILRKLVSIQSYSKQEYAIISWISSYLKQKSYAFDNVDGNIVIHINNDSDKAIIFNAHVDTVAIEDITSWSHDPFTLHQDEQNYYGLGVSDEKASVALLLSMLDEFSKSPIDVIITFVIREELDGAGSARVAEYIKKFSNKQLYCIICEPREAARLGIGHKGNIFFKMLCTGEPIHASTPDAPNAFHKLWDTIQSLHQAFDLIKGGDEVGKPTIALPTKMSGGSCINTLPAKAIAYGDARTTPTTHDAIKKLIGNVAHIESVSSPSLQDTNHPFVKLFAQLGITKTSVTNGSNDMVFFIEQKIPTVVFGPGNEQTAHQVNEYCQKSTIIKARDIYMKVCHGLGSNKQK